MFSCSQIPEFLIIKVTDPRTKIAALLAVVYHPPRGQSYDQLFEELAQNMNITQKLVICGDFNCHLESQNRYFEELKPLAAAADLSILDTGAWFHEGSSDSWLDVILVDDESNVESMMKSEVPFIDHHVRLQLPKFSLPSINSETSATAM